MAGKRIDELRDILSKAAARDEALCHELEALASDLLEELGADDRAPVWAEIKAVDRERQITAHFVMEDLWLRGDLVFELTPEQTFSVSLLIRDVAHQRHEAGSQRARSQTVIIDPPEPEERLKARKKFFDGIFSNLEGLIRARVGLPAA